MTNDNKQHKPLDSTDTAIAYNTLLPAGVYTNLLIILILRYEND